MRVEKLEGDNYNLLEIRGEELRAMQLCMRMIVELRNLLVFGGNFFALIAKMRKDIQDDDMTNIRQFLPVRERDHTKRMH